MLLYRDRLLEGEGKGEETGPPRPSGVTVTVGRACAIVFRCHLR